jgi:hypothetical protein
MIFEVVFRVDADSTGSYRSYNNGTFFKTTLELILRRILCLESEISIVIVCRKKCIVVISENFYELDKKNLSLVGFPFGVFPRALPRKSLC